MFRILSDEALAFVLIVLLLGRIIINHWYLFALPLSPLNPRARLFVTSSSASSNVIQLIIIIIFGMYARTARLAAAASCVATGPGPGGSEGMARRVKRTLDYTWPTEAT
jgi:hypothetical protein